MRRKRKQRPTGGSFKNDPAGEQLHRGISFTRGRFAFLRIRLLSEASFRRRQPRIITQEQESKSIIIFGRLSYQSQNKRMMKNLLYDEELPSSPSSSSYNRRHLSSVESEQEKINDDGVTDGGDNCNDDDAEHHDDIMNDDDQQHSSGSSASFCSVLNVVIDHSMEKASPMEEEEWSLCQDDPTYYDRIRVPVVRIFGPIVRHNDNNQQHQSIYNLPPLQSACLYIHGVFPYILARPVIAGPDGSYITVRQQQGDPTATITNINWDDPTEVETITSDIKNILENTLQSMDLGYGDKNNNNNNTNNNKSKNDNNNHNPTISTNNNERNITTKKKTNHPIIRKVTVVEGRGFYTFCPGPAAPFLKIEYYDPKVRWKVKLILEKGLEVPQKYYPDPRQYGRIQTNDDDDETTMEPIIDDVLKFHCFEGHIPYTMQFFKDYNLAGMSYIHLQKGKIRGTLPSRLSTTNKMHLIRKLSHKDGQEQEMTIHQSVFLESNTPDYFRWSHRSEDLIQNVQQKQKVDRATMPTGDQSDGDDVEKIAPSKPLRQKLDLPPPEKGTSCDVELDCSVHDIQNVENVLTSLPSDQDERDKIQWRAVPSLQEIWKEERSRMNKLLSPELTQEVVQSVLSQKPSSSSSPPSPAAKQQERTFTLNVKENAPRSGARLAAEGMWSLVNVTAGLQEDFLRVLSDILTRHHNAIQRVDESLQRNQSEPLRTNQKGSTSDRGIQDTPLSMNKDNRSFTSTSATPTMNEAIDALEALGSSIPGSQNHNDGQRELATYFSPTVAEAVNALDSMAEASPGIHDIQDTAIFSPESNGRSPFSCYTERQNLHSQPLSYDSAFDTNKALELSQRIERGESVLDSDQDLDDFIDPETLAPYYRVDFDHDRCRTIFQVETDSPNVRRLCGFRACSCPREGHHDVTSQRAKPGSYKTISTGVVIDGILEFSNRSYQDTKNDDDEDDEAELEVFCQLSQVEYDSQIDLATQPTQNLQSSNFKEAHRSQRTADPSSFGIDDLNEDDVSSEEGHDEGEDFDHLDSDSPSLLEIEDCSAEGSTTVSTLDEGPPSRGQVSSLQEGSKLHRLVDSSIVPDWLVHASSYKVTRDKIDIATTDKLEKEGFYVQPAVLAPSRGEVSSWCRRRYRLREDNATEDNVSNKKRRKAASRNGHGIDQLKIDSNSRMIVPLARNTGENNERSNHSKVYQDIEEVLWESSQQWQMTPTQQSQSEMEQDEQNLFDNQDLSPEPEEDNESPASNDPLASTDTLSMETKSQEVNMDALEGIGNQGGRIHIQGGGGLKAKTRHTQLSEADLNEGKECSAEGKSKRSLASPISVMSIEVHIQCREGTSRLDARKISMKQDSTKDRISAIVYVFACDPGGGNSIEIIQRGCICTTLDGENPEKDADFNKNVQMQLLKSMPRTSMGIESPLSVEVVKDERQILRRFKDIVRIKDPDMLLSWDTQGAGLGYIIERGVAIGKTDSRQDESSRGDSGLNMVQLLGRTPKDKNTSNLRIPAESGQKELDHKWAGSGLGSDWDEKVGAGAAAASIIGRLVFSAWKIISEEVKHGNASYLPAVVAAVLDKRIPFHDDLTLSKWYASGTERWKVLGHRLAQGTVTLLLFDALDIIGRAGEAARLSGVEFSQSFPGIRGSQYKVEGVLLRALQSLRSDERGAKKGRRIRSGISSQKSGLTSFSEETKSQTQSPWKVRRQNTEMDQSANNGNRQYFFFSPSQEDTNKQEALEVQALTLEPASGHYCDPVVVCDFTALYPSLIIAYNLCYSTVAGKLDHHSTRKEMQIEGKTRGRIGPIVYPERRTATILKHHLKSMAGKSCKSWKDSDRAYVSPNGAIYLSESVLKGVLPQVLDEILTTRAMLKRAAKEYKKTVKDLSPAILRQLEARQLALKYVANVTYGYTSATFSGRSAMPILADTIVECGRRTLRRAIHIANQWGNVSQACRIL